MNFMHRHDARRASGSPQDGGPFIRCHKQFPAGASNMGTQPHRIGRALFIAALPMLLVACTEKAPQGTPVDVTLRDFHIQTTQQTVAAGSVVFQVQNDAPMTHEFIVVRTDLPDDQLPIGSDGLSVNEEWLSSVGEIDEVPASESRSLALDLAPGRYVFFCNLEGHYLGGMHGVLEVTG
jgi:uncharacterized cupredoxin-like copper-binding protein